MTDNQNSSRRMATDYSCDCAVHSLKELGGRFAPIEIIIFDEATLQIALGIIRSPLEFPRIALAQLW